MLRIGQDVVCVNNGPHPMMLTLPGSPPYELEVGKVYRVRWTGSCPHPASKGETAIRVVGIIRPDDVVPEWSDMPFSAWRFRPVVARKTDISVFERMLYPANQKRFVEIK